MSKTKPSVAVILSGCGFKDGSEIHEAVMTLLAIDRQGGQYQCFAPDVEQACVVNHVSGEQSSESRNVLIESARIARGQIKPLSMFDAKEFDALIMPGGFGAATNLSTFAQDGAQCSVNDAVTHAVKTIHEMRKPIGALCIAPVILAKLIPGALLTIGQDAGVAQSLGNMSAQHQNTSHGEICVDEANRLVSTPCYMLNASVGDIADGAHHLVKALFKWIAA